MDKLDINVPKIAVLEVELMINKYLFEKKIINRMQYEEVNKVIYEKINQIRSR